MLVSWGGFFDGLGQWALRASTHVFTYISVEQRTISLRNAMKYWTAKRAWKETGPNGIALLFEASVDAETSLQKKATQDSDCVFAFGPNPSIMETQYSPEVLGWVFSYLELTSTWKKRGTNIWEYQGECIFKHWYTKLLIVVHFKYLADCHVM